MSRGARFDDLRHGRARCFDPPDEVLVATTPDEVAGVLAGVDAATAAGAWAYGHLAYEAATGLDPHLVTHPPEPDGPPLAWFGLTRTPPREVPVVERADAPTGRWSPREGAAGHAAAVARVQEHIAAGLTYQTNLTARVDGELDLAADPDLTGLYADLAHAQRGAHHALLDLGRFVVVSASPELFVRRDGDELTLRPMKGTAARGRTSAEDAAIAARLRADPKERAENVMIVDLLRNDVSRVAVEGTVRVGSLCAAERFETVWQLTSGITATARPDTGVLELMRALFPCGSVTGAPKGSTMRLITELEDDPRGVYCGAIGWVAPPDHGTDLPDLQFSVAIRTAVVDRTPPDAPPGTARAVYGTGGGITWDSDPAAEHAETRAKARVLTHRPPAVGLLETFAVRGGHAVNRERHLARLVDSAAFLGLDATAVRPTVDEQLTGVREARVRVVLRPDGAVEVTLAPLPSDGGPVVLAPPLVTDPVDASARWPHHKTTDREPYTRRLATARRTHADADDVVLVNTAGELTETTIASLAVRLDERWFTPPLGGGALPGVARAVLVERGDLTERMLSPDDLERASGLAVVSSLRGWRPAVLAPALTPWSARP
ncbi:chorismate-binding protein [Actinomycetospora endophytica]|uniref:Chorismate-binding protein n=1 Tax=Actinomycetospora endophytica TaxID=2291215 RepID=A0ABS8PEE4_9PSEU|nr:chorismate-binding protein [Actinomycetospora endophytica]MCD2196636.1 chorismate-binding protein [Actinomycetospora endophytica]